MHAAQRGEDGSEGFRWAFTCGDREIPARDPAADITVYAREQPDPASTAVTDGRSAPPESRLPVSYERHLIRRGP